MNVEGIIKQLLQERNQIDASIRAIERFAAFGYERVKPPLVEFEESLLGGTGTGTVSAAETPPFVCMVGPCTRVFPTGTSVTLTATPNPDSGFASWSACPAPSGRTCTVRLGEPTRVQADFTAVLS